MDNPAALVAAPVPAPGASAAVVVVVAPATVVWGPLGVVAMLRWVEPAAALLIVRSRGQWALVASKLDLLGTPGTGDVQKLAALLRLRRMGPVPWTLRLMPRGDAGWLMPWAEGARDPLPAQQLHTRQDVAELQFQLRRLRA